MENEKINITKKSNTKTIIATISIVVIFLGLLFITFSYFNSPKKKFIDGINKVFNTLLEKESNDKLNKILSSSIVGLEGEAKLSLSGDGLDESLKLFDNTTIKYNYIEDKKNKTASLDFNSSINNETLVNMYGLIKDNKLYFNLKNIINKYYYTEYNFTELLTNANDEDIKYIANILKDTLISNLDNDYFSKSKDTLKINGKNENVKKISFKFTDKFIVDVISDFAKSIKEDNKALKILADYNNLSKKEILETLNEAINSSNELTTSNEEFVLNIYVKDYTKTLKYELVIDTTKISYYDYEDIKEFSVSENEVKYLNVEIKNNKDVSGTLAMIIPFSGTYEDGKLDLNISYLTMDCNIVVDVKEEYRKDSINSNIDFKLNIKDSSKEYLNIGIKSKNTISKFDKINELNVQSSISVDEISEKDQNTIINKLSEMTILKEIINIYEQNMNTINYNSLEVSGINQEITF